jgi:exo-beta-1,3-glucanase (GH17 family)
MPTFAAFFSMTDFPFTLVDVPTDNGTFLPKRHLEIFTDLMSYQRIRLYGADCNQTSLVMDAIQRTKVNMTVYIGNYPVSTDNNTAYLRQRDELVKAIDDFGTDNIGGVTVGNEFMLNYMTAHGTNDPNSAIAEPGAELLIADIDDTRSNLTSMDLPKTLLVGTSDAGSYFSNEVMEKVDYIVCSDINIQALSHSFRLSLCVDVQCACLVRRSTDRTSISMGGQLF